MYLRTKCEKHNSNLFFLVYFLYWHLHGHFTVVKPRESIEVNECHSSGNRAVGISCCVGLDGPESSTRWKWKRYCSEWEGFAEILQACYITLLLEFLWSAGRIKLAFVDHALKFVSFLWDSEVTLDGQMRINTFNDLMINLWNVIIRSFFSQQLLKEHPLPCSLSDVDINCICW